MSKMPVIFLDCDGVVNCDRFVREWIAVHGDSSESMAEFKSRYFVHGGETGFIVPELLDRLKSVCDSTDCRIVWSSSWRGNYWIQDPDSGEERFDWGGIARLWRAKGLPLDRLMGCTPCLDLGRFSYVPRGVEIQKWLDENAGKYNVGRAAVVDDDEDAIVSVAYEDARFFRTTFEEGLAEDVAENVVQWLLNGKEQS